MNLTVQHDRENKMFTMEIAGSTAKVEYQIQDGKMYLTYSEIPYELRGKGYGKELVEKTFQLLTDEGYTAIAVCSYVRAVAQRSQKWSSIIG